MNVKVTSQLDFFKKISGALIHWH